MTKTFSQPSYQQLDRANPVLDLEKAVNRGSASASQSWWHQKSIRFKTTAIAIALGTLPTIALGAISYHVASRSMNQEIASTRKTLVRDLQHQVNVFMRDRFSDIQVMANLKVFKDPRLSQIVSTAEKSAVLQQIQDAYQIYNSIAVFDIQGNVIAQTGEQALGNHLNRGYVQAALKANAPVISQPRISTSSGIFSIYMAAPIKDRVTGKAIGFVRARMPVEKLKQLLQNYTSKGSQYYLLDGSGAIFLGSQGEYVIKKLSNESQVENQTYDYEAINVNKIFATIEKLLTSNEVKTKTSINLDTNTQQLIAFAPPTNYPGLPELNWQAIIATDSAVAFAPQRQLGLIFLMGTGAVALIISAVANAIASRLLKPILSAAHAVEEIGKGNLDARVDAQGDDELAQLGSNINLMATRIDNFVREQSIVAQQAEVIKDMTLRFALVSDKAELLDIAVAETKNLLQADRVVFYQFNEDWQRIIIAESVEGKYSSALGISIDDPNIEESLISDRGSQVININNIDHAELNPLQLEHLKSLAVKACLIAPVRQQSSLVGLLVAHQCSQPREWQVTEMEVLEQIAYQVSFAIERLEFLAQQQQAEIREKQAKEEIQIRALNLIQEVAKVSEGDLTIRARVTGDEIGTIADSYNSTIASLQKLVTQVKDAAIEVKTTTGENELAVQQLAQETINQAEAIGVTLNQVYAMNESILSVAENAAQAENVVTRATKTIEAGDMAMNQTVAEINTIQNTVTEAAQKVKQLGDSSQEISHAVSLIGRFAAQTHLLALKASIEAARAGARGKGFAVIADEVRSLATQSAAATTEIDNLVTRIQLETNEVVNAMNAGTEQVATGTELIEQTRQSLNEVTTASSQISQLVQAISQAAKTQSTTSQEVSKTMTNVAAIAQDNSQSATKVSTAIQQLSTVAEKLQADIGRFKT